MNNKDSIIKITWSWINRIQKLNNPAISKPVFKTGNLLNKIKKIYILRDTGKHPEEKTEKGLGRRGLVAATLRKVSSRRRGVSRCGRTAKESGRAGGKALRLQTLVQQGVKGREREAGRRAIRSSSEKGRGQVELCGPADRLLLRGGWVLKSSSISCIKLHGQTALHPSAQSVTSLCWYKQ